MDTNKKVNVLLELQKPQGPTTSAIRPAPRGKEWRAYKQDKGRSDGVHRRGGPGRPHGPRREGRPPLHRRALFDIVGRSRTAAFLSSGIDRDTIVEEFEIKVRNHKKEEVMVVKVA